MEIRKIKFPQDIDPLLEVSLAAFQYPENPAWSIDQAEAEELKDQINAIKRYWLLLRLGMLFSKTLRHLLDGFVCIEDEKMVGVVMFQQQRGKNLSFYINNVGVHPDYRGRGIARKLVETTLAEMRGHGECKVLLDVISGNVPAYHLYESLGWEHFSGDIHFVLDANQQVNPPASDENFEVINIPLSNWKTSFDFMDRITPSDVRKYKPVIASAYKSNRVLDFLEILAGVKQEKIILRNTLSGEIIGLGKYMYRTRKGGTNSARIYIDPAYSQASALLIDTICSNTQKLAPGRRIEIMAAAWQPDVKNCALAKGFTLRYEYHSMGMLIEKQIAQKERIKAYILPYIE